MMKKLWKTILIVSLILVILGSIVFGVGKITGADYGRVQDLFCSAHNVSSVGEYFTGIANSLFGIQPLN